MEEKHLPDIVWHLPNPMKPDLKPNGIRFPALVGKVRPYLVEQMQAMNLDGENSLHRSNSSSNSSLNETPPSTPLNTPASTPQGPGRGETTTSRANGMPSGPSPGLHIPDTTSPPPPPRNSSVPTVFRAFVLTPCPNRSMFQYNPAYRPTFTAQYPAYPTTDTANNFPPYTLPYFHLMFSSPYPARTPPGCFNCGAPNHVGSECTNQNIEEITQKKTFQLDYAASLQPHSEK
ncbi:hypothetical protein JTB14_010756 [Gonioctena quinquepunctata]|nr:hypothetical protein JTB14_010756 [Gonioctena quinquepunctata]